MALALCLKLDQPPGSDTVSQGEALGILAQGIGAALEQHLRRPELRALSLELMDGGTVRISLESLEALPDAAGNPIQAH